MDGLLIELSSMNEWQIHWWMTDWMSCVSEFMITRRLTLWCSRQPSSCRWRSLCPAFAVSMTTCTSPNTAHHWLKPVVTSQKTPVTIKNLDSSTQRLKFVWQEPKGFCNHVDQVLRCLCPGPAGDSGPVLGPAEERRDNEKFKVSIQPTKNMGLNVSIKSNKMSLLEFWRERTSRTRTPIDKNFKQSEQKWRRFRLWSSSCCKNRTNWFGTTKTLGPVEIQFWAQNFGEQNMNQHF